MDFIVVLFFVFELGLGLLAMWWGAKVLIEAITWLGKVTGVADLSLGAALVSVVTILVELFLGVVAVTHGLSSLVVTQVSGVVVFNLGLILGISLLFSQKNNIDRVKLIWRGGTLIAVLVLVWMQAENGFIDQGEALVLLLLMAIIVIFSLWEIAGEAKWSALAEMMEDDSKRKRVSFLNLHKNQIKEKGRGNLILNIARLIAGMMLLMIAAAYFLRNGIQMALIFHWSIVLLAGTVLVWGAGLPQLMTTMRAVKSKKSELSVGNILGVSLMCLTLVIGMTAWLSNQSFLGEWQSFLTSFNDGKSMINEWRIFGDWQITSSNLQVPARVVNFDLPLALVLAVIALFPAVIKGRFFKWQGVVLVLVYIFYVVRIVMW